MTSGRRFAALRSAIGSACTRRDDYDRTSSIDRGQVLESGTAEVAQCLVAS